jgi:SAM-dependent methyltransferase
MSATKEVQGTPGTNDIRDTVREKYGALAEGNDCGCGCATGAASCCSTDESSMTEMGYSAEQLATIPDGANLGLGCGNPLAHAGVKQGETVLDLGSGAGIDAFLAAREVGPTGHVIGVDMTASMIRRARENAAKGGYTNVEFRLGEIENLPVADGSVDVIISNCVINLSPEKPRVFTEALRALKPGGRLVVSDLVLTKPIPDAVRKSIEAYVGCVAGASLRDDCLRQIRDAGFQDVAVLEERSYGADGPLPAVVVEQKAWDAVASVKVRAVKPAK